MAKTFSTFFAKRIALCSIPMYVIEAGPIRVARNTNNEDNMIIAMDTEEVLQEIEHSERSA